MGRRRVPPAHSIGTEESSYGRWPWPRCLRPRPGNALVTATGAARSDRGSGALKTDRTESAPDHVGSNYPQPEGAIAPGRRLGLGARLKRPENRQIHKQLEVHMSKFRSVVGVLAFVAAPLAFLVMETAGRGHP